MPADDWYRSEAWDAPAQELFETKLKRVRSSPAQCVLIKGLALIGTGDGPRVTAGRALLRRVFDEYRDDETSVSRARYGLADSRARDGLYGEAEHSLRECLAIEASGRAAGRNFSTRRSPS